MEKIKEITAGAIVAFSLIFAPYMVEALVNSIL